MTLKPLFFHKNSFFVLLFCLFSTIIFAQVSDRCELNLISVNKQNQTQRLFKTNSIVNICNNDTLLLKSTPDSLLGAVYKWYKNGVLMADSTKNTFTVITSGTYSLTVSFTNKNCTLQSPDIKCIFTNNLGNINLASYTAYNSKNEHVICENNKEAYLFVNTNNIHLHNPIIEYYKDKGLWLVDSKVAFYTNETGEYRALVKSKECISTSNALTVAKGNSGLFYNGAIIRNNFIKTPGAMDSLNVLGCFGYIDAGLWTYQSGFKWYSNNDFVSSNDILIPVANNTKYSIVSKNYFGGCTIKDSVFVKKIKKFNQLNIYLAKNTAGKYILDADVSKINLNNANIQWYKNNIKITDVFEKYTPLEIDEEIADYKCIIDIGDSCGIFETKVFKFNTTQLKIELYQAENKTQRKFTECANGKLVLNHSPQGDKVAQLYRNGVLSQVNNPFNASKPYDYNSQFTITESGYYYVKLLDTGNTKIVSDSIQVVFNEPVNTIINLEESICNGSKLVVPKQNNVQYQWLEDSKIINGATLNEYQLSKTGIAVYSLVVTAGSCFYISKNLTMNYQPKENIKNTSKLINSTNYKTTNCIGENLNLKSITASTFSWTGPNGFKANTQNIDLNNLQVKDKGVYTLEISINGCILKDSILVSVKSNPILEPNISFVDICKGSTLIITAPKADQYFWYKNNIQIANAQAITLDKPGIYFVELVQDNCTLKSKEIEITQNKELPTATLSGGGIVLPTDSTQLKVSFTGTAPWTFSLVNQPEITTSINPFQFKLKSNVDNTYELKTVKNTCGFGAVSGKALVSVVLTNEKIEKTKISIYPNPTQDYINIGLGSNVTGNLKVNMFTLDGKKIPIETVENKNLKNTKTVNIANLPSAVYQLKVVLNGKVNVYKVVKK